MLKKILTFVFCIFLSSSYLYGENVLKFAATKNVGPGNPHLYSPNEMYMQNMLFESLVEYTDEGKTIPWLAKSWEISDDGMHYTFKLREDVKFSNGDVFDAKAVKTNFDMIMKNEKRHNWLELVNIIESVDIIDDYTIKLNLRNSYEPTLRELALVRPFRFIAPSAVGATGDSADGIKEPIGTGPWKLVDTKKGVSDTFVRNDNYWGEKPKYDKVIATVIPDSNSKIIALKTGVVDLIYGSGQISPDAIKTLENDKKLNVLFSNPLTSQTIAINTNKEPTNDIAVRKAINHAVNKEEIAKNIFFDTQKPADFLLSTSVPYADIGLKPYKFDAGISNKLLDDAGWKLDPKTKIRSKNGKALELNLIYLGDKATEKSAGEIIQARLSNIGIKLNLVPNEKTLFYQKQQAGDFNMIYNETWGAPYDPQAYLSSMRVPSHADYQAQLGLGNKKQIDKDITELLRTHDEALRVKLITNVLTSLHDQAVYLPLIYTTGIAAFSNNVGGVRMSIKSYDIPFNEMYPKK